VLPLAGGGTGYKVRVFNTGRTPAAGFDVTVTGEGLEASATADRLEAGEDRRIVVGGPPCRPGTTVRIVVDAQGNVDEADESDNDVTVTCPG
jgi:subtilase family serine protease